MRLANKRWKVAAWGLAAAAVFGSGLQAQGHRGRLARYITSG